MKTGSDRLCAAWFDKDGSSAVEFALIAPVLFMLTIGAIGLFIGLWTYGSMQFAVEEAARCASVKTTVCDNNSTTVAYAQSHYFAPGSPTFTYTASSCGNSVSASVSYVLNTGLSRMTLPLSASACFP